MDTVVGELFSFFPSNVCNSMRSGQFLACAEILNLRMQVRATMSFGDIGTSSSEVAFCKLDSNFGISPDFTTYPMEARANGGASGFISYHVT